MECITMDVKNNWALKLANLRRLKKGLDKYAEEELKVSISKFDRIDLPSIARKCTADAILKLFEYVMYTVVQCPIKNIFIRRIMEMDEAAQIQLMFFIQNIMGDDVDSSTKENQTQKREIEVLKSENRKITEQLLELEQELSLAHEEYAILHSNYNQLKFENERMNSEIDHRSAIVDKESNAVSEELRARLAEKDLAFFEMQKSYDKAKKQHESEIVQIRDELDIATSKLLEASNMEKVLYQYKKRMEGYFPLKQQLEDLQKENNTLSETISLQNVEIDSLVKTKILFNSMKESLEKERNKSEILSYNVESKEKLIKKFEISIADYKQKVIYLTKRNEELMYDDRADSMQGSEDSFVYLQNKESNGVLHEIRHKNSMIPVISEEEEQLLKETEKYKLILGKKKEKLKSRKEITLMAMEEMGAKCYSLNVKIYHLGATITELQEHNYVLSEEIQKLLEQLKDKETEKIMYEQAFNELEEVKLSKVSLASEVKNLHIEKEQINKKFLEKTEEFQSTLHQINLKDSQISEINVEVLVLKDELQSFREKENLYKKEIELLKTNPINIIDDSKNILEFEQESIALKSQISSLQLRTKDKDNKLNKLKEDYERELSEMKQKLNECRQEFENELERKNEDMTMQLEEAMIELTKHREFLAAKLQAEKRHSVVNFHRAMSIKDPSSMISKELFQLRETLVEKENEISRLIRNNKEIKKCWKRSAKLLKAVWKELGKETQKIEDAVRERISL